MPCVAFLFDSVGMGNIIVLFLVILIAVGPKRLPEVARKLGRMMETFRRAADEFKTQIMSMDQEPPPSHTPSTTDVDGVSQSSSESSSSSDDEAYKQIYQDSPYPGNEHQYDEALNEPKQEADATPPAAVEQPVADADKPPEGTV